MKCISLWQPWASLMVYGEKQNETRSWATSHRGVIAIHAAKTWNGQLSELALSHPFRAALRDCLPVDEWFEPPPGWLFRVLPFGAILGTVEIVDCVRITDANAPTGNERAFGDYTPGRFMWQTRNFFRFPTPIPFRGAQGVFEVPDSILPRIVPAPEVRG